MRHRRRGRKLGRNQSHREALNRNLARSLLLHKRIKTTLGKAKEVIPFASRLITLAKRDTIASRRRAASVLGGDRTIVKKLFTEIAPEFAGRNGGYIRLVKLPVGRLGDNAPQAFLELVTKELQEQPAAEKRQMTAKEQKAAKKAEKKARRKEEKKKEQLASQQTPPPK
jgi:large subunit ribosomal protein L17